MTDKINFQKIRSLYYEQYFKSRRSKINVTNYPINSPLIDLNSHILLINLIHAISKSKKIKSIGYINGSDLIDSEIIFSSSSKLIKI